MKKLLPCTALVMCAGMACAQAEERNDWHFNIGAMYEIENVEGYGEDMDGLAEPSVYFNAANGPWRIALAYYQEGPVDYSAGKRGTWFDRPELEVHYQFLENDDFSFGLTGGFRNYGYHYVDEPGKDTANMQRWKIAPDWDVKLTDDLRFNGWLSMYKFGLNATSKQHSASQRVRGCCTYNPLIYIGYLSRYSPSIHFVLSPAKGGRPFFRK